MLEKTGIRGLAFRSPTSQLVAAVVIANVCHVLSVLVLHRLTRLVFPDGPAKYMAFCAASLHIISPAGLFLSAPYAESLFSLLSFLGYFLYAKSLREDESQAWLARDLYVLVAGVACGFATAVRNNGILSGIIFAYDSVEALWQLLVDPNMAAVRRVVVLVVAGVFVALGAILPQSAGYREFCRPDLHPGTFPLRPWCSDLVPSIYRWVQRTYWFISPMQSADYLV